ncbi:MAG: hypothetical protein WA510_00180 [Acidobacteriaceae bacterium]
MFSGLRIFAPPKFPVLSLDVRAQMPVPVVRERSQFHLLVRHSLDRFFNNDLISAESDEKARFFQVLHAFALPGAVVALYLAPLYHRPDPRTFWSQASDHYFYVTYSLVALGVLTIFAWDLFFPDLLDVNVLAPLPIPSRRLFLARILAACLFLGLFVSGINVLGIVFYPLFTEQPGMAHLMLAHTLAVLGSGAFAAGFFLALQGTLVAVFGERLARTIAPFLQGISTTILLTVLLLFPASSQFLEPLTHTSAAGYFPPFWFLGIYEVLLSGSSSPPVFRGLAKTGCIAMAIVAALVVVSYPLAYRRKMRHLVEGSGRLETRAAASALVSRLLHAIYLRSRVQRGIYHFISYSLLRTQRYRVYLAMYGGLGLALIVAGGLLLKVQNGHVGLALSADGVRVAIPIAAFWTIAGLRTAFLSAADKGGGWVFRVILGRPGAKHLETAMLWILPCALLLTLALVALTGLVAPQELRGWKSLLIEALAATGLCVLLTDALFVNVTSLPFTGEGRGSTNNLALILLQYFGLFPPLILITVSLEPWLAENAWHVAAAMGIIAAAHFALHTIHKERSENYANLIDLDEDEEEFPQRLGLRY